MDSALGMVAAYLLLNIGCWVIGTPWRFGWYNKDEEERGREL